MENSVSVQLTIDWRVQCLGNNDYNDEPGDRMLLEIWLTLSHHRTAVPVNDTPVIII